MLYVFTVLHFLEQLMSKHSTEKYIYLSALHCLVRKGGLFQVYTGFVFLSFSLTFQISDFCTVELCQHTLTWRNTLWHCTTQLHNSLGHYATYIGIVQQSKSNFRDLVSVLDGSLPIREGLPTFACKSMNADRQDWYILMCRLDCGKENVISFSGGMALKIVFTDYFSLFSFMHTRGCLCT